MKKFSWLILPASILLCSSALADSYKKIIHNIDASTLEEARLEISVGELDIEVYDGDEIQLEIELEAERSWLSFRRRDVSDIELQVGGNGSRVTLMIDERNLRQT